MSTQALLIPQDAARIPAGETITCGRAYGCVPALALAERAAASNTPILVIVPTVAEAEALETQLHFFSATSSYALFPDPETLPYDAFSPHQELIARRLTQLADLLSGERQLIIIAVPTLFYRLPPASFIRDHSLHLHTGQKLGREELTSLLLTCGYERVSQVSEHGDFAVRGSLVDVYPTGMSSPVRVDFFDDEIETLRTFDPDSQLTLEQIDSLQTLPARDFPTEKEAISTFRGRYREHFQGNPAESLIYSEVSESRFPGGIENYLPLFFDDTATFWDYLPDDCALITIGDIKAEFELVWEQICSRHEQYRHDIERPALQPEMLFCPGETHLAAMAKLGHLRLDRHELPEATQTLNLPCSAAPPVLINRQAEHPIAELQNFCQNFSGRVLLVAESAGRREMLIELLRDQSQSISIADNWQAFLETDIRLSITTGELDKGAVLDAAGIALIAEHELFGARPTARKKRRVRDPEKILHDLTDLREGAPVVHIDYGVGRYLGISHLEIDDVANDFLTLEYAGGDRLHVPVGSLQLISRYTGTSPENAPLHKLGSGQWEKARQRAEKQIRDVAAEMLDLYATRAARNGRSFRVSPADFASFNAGFPFELTEDQAVAIDATVNDLRQPQSMDRLICGDVGFGKTEVALRAAFTVAMAGSQVAILAPTTLLAQQHYQTFLDRFADWPINIQVLSRFRTGRESQVVIDGLAKGTVDIVIGTHKLLQDSVRFKNIGLIIVDEEHRFGVKQKEQLKAMRAEVDILTLTATPIPRTLNMALGELRELSLITTPPESRLSIKTFVTQWEDNLLREACQRELKRGGQVFFVHNRIADIDTQARKLEEIMPEAKICVAHGQMREKELEQIMLDFYHRRFHILVCTAIIESGIDIPSANTIIINRADRFGLAQLHQLRGRVGRSHHKAFAYLLAPPDHAITADARKRLDAIESMEDLGAGFILATHDLEIRGAGELLGENQTGQIEQIGFNLYTDLLGRAVDAIRRGDTPDFETTRSSGPEVNLHVPALLPEEYLPDVQMRLVHYKRISSAADEAALRQLQIELIDRFGLLPDPTANLFRQTRIKLRAATLGIRKIEGWPGGVTMEFTASPNVDPARIIALIQADPARFAFDSRQRLKMQDDLSDAEERFKAVDGILDNLTARDDDSIAAHV
jgi:transcription-repair coupling factor (superfamily II helicase)